MRTIDRVTILEQIGVELQKRFGFDDIDIFLAGFGLSKPENVTVNSKRVYAKAGLAPATNEVILKVAEELDIDVPQSFKAAALPSVQPMPAPVPSRPSELTEGDRLFALRDIVLANFTGGNWRELGLFTGCDDIVTGHGRLLRSMNFNDPDYEEHVLPVLISISARDPGNLAKMEDFVRKRFETGENISSGRKAGKTIVFQPKVFEIPDAPVEPMLVSVMMPFNAGMRPVYAAIDAAATAAGYQCQKADDIWEHSAVIQDIFSLIYRSFIVVCDFTGRNANVFYEAGVAHTLGKHVVPISQSDGDIPFDLRHHRQLGYLNNGEGLQELQKKLTDRFRTLNAQR
ncbi:hypothetical protein [Bosea psychrotolerans]|uniref:AbiJ N-terminal domain-containing protein n=1 Tax=Bosea psychrotolerans TaxID=1871628 RepID=A0A2S4M8N8_9HYPH|nr:hypothetical protein [Bosea psychrotolerans]POR50887.1 hypothetical protein CYD53_108135 [Bosea psychrotolerans]